MRRILLILLATSVAAAESGVDRARVREELDAIADGMKLSRAFNLIHRLVAPSVVSIHINAERLGIDPVRRRLERREVKQGEGSGFVVHTDAGHCYVLTNAHVVLQRNELGEFVRDDGDQPVWQPLIRIILNDQRSFEAGPVGADPETDLAVLRIPAPDVPPVEWADSDRVEVGDWVLALGYPLGVGYSASSGIISATGRSTGVYRTEHGYESFLQTDAAINPGNSGGPLVDLHGRIIGVNANILSSEGGRNIGVGFAISANLARNVAEDLLDDGRVSRPMFGVRTEPLGAAEAGHLGVPDRQGVKVEWIMPQSPAASAGLLAGDVVLAIDGVAVAGVQQFRTAVASLKIGRPVAVDIWRDGRRERFEVTPIAWDAFHDRVMEELKRRAVALPGFGIHLGDDEFIGVPVVAVAEGSAAARAGLVVGDRILRVDGVGPVARAADLQPLDGHPRLVVEVFRNRRVLLLVLQKQD
jgi:S1-C subfamily serine protease